MDLRPLVSLVLALAPQAAGREGTVTGALSLNGAPVVISHVWATAEPGFFDKSTEDVRLLFSDVPLSDADRKDVFALSRLGREGEARILEVLLDADGRAIAGSIYAKEFNGEVSLTGMHEFVRERFERTAIAGRLFVREPNEFMGITFQYDLRFSAPIPRPPSAAERTASLASPPARAASGYLAAIRRGDPASVRAAMTADAGAAFAGKDGSARLAGLRDDMPADAVVVAIEPLTDGSVLAKVEGHRDDIAIDYTLRVVETPGGWKVGPPL